VGHQGGSSGETEMTEPTEAEIKIALDWFKENDPCVYHHGEKPGGCPTCAAWVLARGFEREKSLREKAEAKLNSKDIRDALRIAAYMPKSVAEFEDLRASILKEKTTSARLRELVKVKDAELTRLLDLVGEEDYDLVKEVLAATEATQEKP